MDIKTDLTKSLKGHSSLIYLRCSQSYFAVVLNRLLCKLVQRSKTNRTYTSNGSADPQ
jgi:hypothetical protein